MSTASRRPAAGLSLARLVLSPCLLLQGRQVRRHALRLPEPSGERQGTLGVGPRLNFLVLGDSAAAGVGVEHQSQALAGLLAERLGASYSGSWKLLARTGHRIADVRRDVAAAPVEAFALVILAVGVNDATGGTEPARWRAHLLALLTEIGEKFGPRDVIVCAVPPMHQFPALPQPLRWYLGRRARMLNRVTVDAVAGRAGCRFLAMGVPLTERYMARDGFHPGAPGYAYWAERVVETMAAP